MNSIVKSTTRSLRKNQTESERTFWEIVRNRKLFGKKFLRQHPVQLKFMGKKRFFVGDFYCAEKKIIIEIDGKIHENREDYDNLRDHLINEMGIRVIRIKNDDLADIPALIEKLKPDFL